MLKRRAWIVRNFLGVSDPKSSQNQERYSILPGTTRNGLIVDQNFPNYLVETLVPDEMHVGAVHVGPTE